MGTVAVATLALVLAAVGPAVAGPDDDPVPSEADIASAEAAVQTKASDVESVQARLAGAEQRLERTEIAAIQAAEVVQRRALPRPAGGQGRPSLRSGRPTRPAASSAVQREAYADAVNTSYQLGPSLSPLAALANADGVSGVLENSTLLEQAAAAIDDTYETLRGDGRPGRVRRRPRRRGSLRCRRDQGGGEGRARPGRGRDRGGGRPDRGVRRRAERADRRAGRPPGRERRPRPPAPGGAGAGGGRGGCASGCRGSGSGRRAEQAAQEAAQAAAQQAAQDAAEQAAQDAAEQAQPNQPTSRPRPTTDPHPHADPDAAAGPGGHSGPR